jgi:hypothetical protein
LSPSKIAFFQQKQAFHYDFSAEPLTSDGGLLIVAKQMRRLGLVSFFDQYIPDRRDHRYVAYTGEQLLGLRLMLLCCGYEDCNDVEHLKNDPALRALCGGELPCQPTLSRWENALTLGDVAHLAERMIDYYVANLDPQREAIIIDVDCTDDPTHGSQQGSLFHGYYWQWMYNELFYLDGETGQVILPVLRPGNVHSSRWNDRFLRRIVAKIRARFPDMAIHLRADAGFSSPAFYEAVDEMDIGFCVGISSNERLKRLIANQVDEVQEEYVKNDLRHQRFVGPFEYQADSWHDPQDVYAKIESTGKGLNVRFYVSNYVDEKPEELYRDFYVQRGEAAENRIKEIKNFCFSDRLSCQRFSANFFRLILSCMAYEVLRSLRERLPETTKDRLLWVWSVQSIRLHLLKVAAQIKVTVRRVYFRLARGHPYKAVLANLLA